MKQFFCIYRVPVATMDEWKQNTSPEEMKKQGADMMAQMGAWMEKHKASFVGKGYPLGKTKTVSKNGAVDARNDLNYACIVEAESLDAAAALFSDNPHLTIIPNSTIDVMEVPHMGM
jgi:hypothetical protein